MEMNYAHAGKLRWTIDNDVRAWNRLEDEAHKHSSDTHEADGPY